MTSINVDFSDSLKKIDQWDWPLNKEDGMVKVVNTDQKFEVALEAVYFEPKDIEVSQLTTILFIFFFCDLREISVFVKPNNVVE